MKRIVAFTLSIIMMLSMVSYVYSDETLYSGNCGTTLIWSIDSNGILTIDGSGAMDNYAIGGPLAPWYSYGSVINIVKIESNVTSIDAFSFSGLSELKTIYWNATDCTINRSYYETPLFNVSTKDLNVIFGNGVENIPNDAFEDCANLKSVIISNTVTNITHSAFQNCTGLTTITIPNGVTTIGNSVFKGCTGLTSANISDSVTSMGKYVFEDCEKLNKVTLGSGLTSIDTQVFMNCKDLISITIPENVESIGIETFRNCQSLTKIIISESVKSIGRNAFYNCDNLEKVYFKGSKSKQQYLYSFAGNVEKVYDYVPATSIELDQATIELKPGGTSQLVANIFPTNTTFKDVTWISDNTDVVTVTPNGLVEAISGGTATITAETSCGAKAKCEVVVITKVEITSFTVTEQDNEAKVNIVTVDVPSGAKVYIASYDDLGKILELQKITISTGIGQATFSSKDVNRYKAFIWDDNMKPLCSPKEY